MMSNENATKAAEAITSAPVAKPVEAKQVSAPKPVTKVVTKKPAPASKAIVKSPAKVAAKATAKSPAKPLARVTVKTAVKAAAKPLSEAKAKAKAAKPAKEKKPKLVRDSFTIPKDEYTVLGDLKQRAGKLSTQIKKSELLRAGLKALAGMSDAAFLSALKVVPTLKTGRPVKG